MFKSKYFGDIARTPIMALGLILISAIAIFFDTPFIIPVFAASLFTVIIVEESNLSSVKHIVFSHAIAFAFAMIAPIILQNYGLNFISLGGIITIGIIVLIVGLIQTITKVEHPPAIAATIVFLEVNRSGGDLIFGFVPFNLLLSFTAALMVVVAVAIWMDKKKKY